MGGASGCSTLVAVSENSGSSSPPEKIRIRIVSLVAGFSVLNKNKIHSARVKNRKFDLLCCT